MKYFAKGQVAWGKTLLEEMHSAFQFEDYVASEASFADVTGGMFLVGWPDLVQLVAVDKLPFVGNALTREVAVVVAGAVVVVDIAGVAVPGAVVVAAVAVVVVDLDSAAAAVAHEFVAVVVRVVA